MLIEIKRNFRVIQAASTVKVIVRIFQDYSNTVFIFKAGLWHRRGNEAAGIRRPDESYTSRDIIDAGMLGQESIPAALCLVR